MDHAASTASRYSTPTSFRPQPIAAIEPFVSARALCTLVVGTGGGLHAASLPLVADREGAHLVLRGHLARANPGGGSADWRSEAERSEALAIFAGQEDYGVAPAVQAEERLRRGIELFGAVHVYGRIRFVEDGAFLAENMRALSRRHAAGRAHIWNTDRTPDAVIDRLIRTVIGIEFRIERAEACLTWAAACERPGL